jgi:uncharacterized protein YukJ
MGKADLMAVRYGVLRGRVDRFKREDGVRTPHLNVRVLDEANQPWRIAVNVQSEDKSDVVYWVVDPLVGHPILDGLTARSSGFTDQPGDSRHALDYTKAPLFDLALGRVLPPSGSASADDLQDLLSLYLAQCKTAGGEIFAFGAKFTENLHKPIDAEFGNIDGLHGIHDIHMNQGNLGAHAHDNGPFHDGGLILGFAGRHVGVFLAFQTQRVPTDPAGAPVADARPLGAVIGQPVLTGTASDIYIAHALINPGGADPGHEVVVLANLATTPRTLSGWTLTDRNDRTTTVDATVPPGGTAPIALDGTGVQLGNDGGNLILRDKTEATVDSVVYSDTDAKPDNRYVRFRR